MKDERAKLIEIKKVYIEKRCFISRALTCKCGLKLQSITHEQEEGVEGAGGEGAKRREIARALSREREIQRDALLYMYVTEVVWCTEIRCMLEPLNINNVPRMFLSE